MLNTTKYQIADLIYDGTRTLVYRGVKTDDCQPIIVKKLRNQYPTFNELLQFRHQYVLCKNFDLPGVVKPLSLEKEGNGYLLVMEDVGGVSLSEYIDNRNLNIGEFLKIAIALTKILEGLYRKRVIHKDIKPANILINPETTEIYLIDFSISSLLPKETQAIQNPNILEGTLAYISPEQTGRMNRGIDYRSDFYSLGVTFYELLAGEVPFTSEDPMELVHCHIAKMPAELGKRQEAEGKRGGEIPEVVSDIVFKLMAKTAEERYQSAFGLKYDLEKCLQQWEETGSITEFELGERDYSDRFTIPEKLYGREREVEALLQAFARVSEGATEMMLVAGFSGIGKTAVVSEVHKPIVEKRGYFILGKFDQFQRNVPFSALVQAFRDLTGQLLSESDARLAAWKDKILDALGENGRVIIEVIPELEQIIGEQPLVAELSGSAAQNRFNLLFQKFIKVFTTAQHPLVIFVDDLQWADGASLKLMELLMGDSNTGYLLLLGAYRDNEVFPAHPLMLTLDAIASSGATPNTITLAPLNQEDINSLVADTLYCEEAVALPLTELVYQKTKGNPFFATQFLKSLHEDGWIEFDFDIARWHCDITRVRELALTEDVVEFMATRLYKLPAETQFVLKLAACIGNQFDLETLAIVTETSSEEAGKNLWFALEYGLILPLSETYKFYQSSDSPFPIPNSPFPKYKFLHDRVQQAAYSLIPEERKQETHYRIGRLLLQNTPPEIREERIFELVGQLNYGTDLIAEQREREELAKLNLTACRKARGATAYQGGRSYARIGLGLLGEKSWQQQYEMTLAFHDLEAELAMLCGDFEEMERAIATVIEKSRCVLETVNAYRIKIVSNISRNRLTEAIAIAREVLQKLDLTLPETVTNDDIQQAIAEISTLMGEREVEDLLDLPSAIDAEKIATIEILKSIFAAAYISGASMLFALLVALGVKLSIEYGNTSVSASVYSSYGLLACSFLKDVNTGVKFGRLALEVTSKLDAKAVKPEVLHMAGLCTFHRQSHLKETLPLLREGYTAGLEVGNLEFSGYNAQVFCMNSFWCGRPLGTLEPEMRTYQQGLLRLNQLTPANWCRVYWQTTLNLLEGAERPYLMSGEALEEAKFLPQWLSASDYYALYVFYLHKLMLCCLFEEIETARSYAVEVKQYFIGGMGTICEPAFYFYDSLSALAAASGRIEERSQLLQQVEENQMQLQQQWATYAPQNHQHKVDLVAAEKARVLGNRLDAIELYDKAIAGAKENEYLQEEAIANELAAKFYLDWGKEKVAAGYMQEAYYCYARWGAASKIDDLEKRYPQLLTPILERQMLAITPSGTIASLSKGTISHTSTGTGEFLDLGSLMKASRTLSEDIELERAIANLMQVARENAGAETAALMLFEEGVLMLSALVAGEDVTSINPVAAESSDAVPMSIVNLVKNRRKLIAIDNASIETACAGDPYIQKRRPKSILCLPLVDRSLLIGILYLENNRVAGAFASDRAEILTLLCSQAAISLENARLYQKSLDYVRELERAQLQLVQSEKMATVGQLTAGVAHEINNPVGFISGNLSYTSDYVKDVLNLLNLYRETFPQPGERIEEEIEAIDLDYLIEDLPQVIDSMKQGTDRIIEISKSMRTFSRGDTAAKVPFNLHDGIESTLLILKHRLKNNENRPSIEVVKNYGNLPEINCYPGQLNQVFMNIIANAIDAMDESNIGRTFEEIKNDPNRIVITTVLDEEKGEVMVKIKDNGPGMSEEVKAKVFEHLFTTKKVGKGTGLGLSISRQIIEEKHGGKIALISEVGKGTEFCLVIPK